MNKSAPKIAVFINDYVEQEKILKLLTFVAENVDSNFSTKINDFIENQRQHIHYSGKIIYINHWGFGNPYEYNDGIFIDSPDFSKEFKVLMIENDWEEIVNATFKAISLRDFVFFHKIIEEINNELNN